MIIYQGIDFLPQFEKAVLTIGTFDGVHQGHKSILESVVHAAKQNGGTSILITFEPHPRKLIFPDESLRLINNIEERLALVAETGIDVAVVVPFTKEFAALSAENYIKEFLIKLFHPIQIIIGYDHRFGQDRTGDLNMLRLFAEQFHFEVHEISAQLISQAAVSSTKIRKAIEAGNMVEANLMLGRNFSITGVVVHGAQLGRTINYPTANLQVNDEDKLIPKKGVYAVRALSDGKFFLGMLNIGNNPTVSTDTKLKIEVHLFDFDADIYGQNLTLYIVAKIRDEQKFASILELQKQLNLDKIAAQKLLNS